MDLLELFLKIMLTTVFLSFVSLLIYAFDALIIKPEKLRSKLRKQGIKGPPSSFLIGNLADMKKAKPEVSMASEGKAITHNCSSIIFPYFEQWQKEYGPVFTVALGNILVLHINDPAVVKELITSTTLDLGKPYFLYKILGPLLGQGIVSSNGGIWARQRKILAPELYMNKVKGMLSIMVESAVMLGNLWSKEIESAGGIADINVDEYTRKFSGDVISRACFGSNYSKGEEIFKKLRSLEDALSENVLYRIGLSATRFIPTETCRKIRRLEKEVRELILSVVKERKEAKPENDLLQLILDSAINCSDFGEDHTTENFIVDNCKNFYLAGYETTAVSASWILMLLASNPEWQTKARNEVLEVCGGQMPDADMLRRMKTLTMVINEALRLYPPVPLFVREVLKDIKIGDIDVPKGVHIWTSNLLLHHEPEIWGADAQEFKPERFANGVTGACNVPHVYMPFGAGPRTCLGQNFAISELKILIALSLSKFSFSPSPQYKPTPTLGFLIEPENGVNLLIKKL